MEVIGGKRRCGKTMKLIEKAHDEQLYILCASKQMARIIYKQSRDMGIDIPHPISVDELKKQTHW